MNSPVNHDDETYDDEQAPETDAEAGDEHENEYAVEQDAEPIEEAPRTAGDGSFFYSVFSHAPWWAVALAFHILLFALANLISSAIELPDNTEPLVTVTSLQRPVDAEKREEKKDETKSPLASDRDTHATDPTSTEVSNIEVPPDILAKAQIGDHFETINLDRPDTQSAFGNPDAHMFHSVKGSNDEAGGGGASGGSLEDLIGAGGNSSPGSGGGWGGGVGTGTGNDKGSGRGSFGNRSGGGRKLMVKRHGGSSATETSVDLALHWLAAHQEQDGHWDSKKYQGAGHDIAVTSMALLAFLGAGHSEKVGEYKSNVVKAIAWLKDKQGEKGNVGVNGYEVALSTMALSEASAMANIAATREAAQKAVTYCSEVHQCGEGSDRSGWRYSPKQAGDTSVTGWFIMALKSAKVAGLRIDAASFDGAIKFLDSVEKKAEGGDPGYAPASTYGYTAPGGGSHRLTAIGCLCRQFLGWKKEDLQASVDGFVAKGGTPTWDGNGGKVDLYYWYYGTLCVFQQGGDLWKRWNETMKPALTKSQRMDGDEKGSWDPTGANSQAWGRVGQTALSALCMEVYYRYKMLAPEAH